MESMTDFGRRKGREWFNESADSDQRHCVATFADAASFDDLLIAINGSTSTRELYELLDLKGNEGEEPLNKYARGFVRGAKQVALENEEDMGRTSEMLAVKGKRS